MKVGYSATVWDDGGSGIGSYIAEQLRVLESCQGVESSILEFGGRVLPVADRPHTSSTGGGIARILKPLKDVLWHRFGLRKAAERCQFEVVHVPTIRRLPARLPCPTVVTVHDLAPVRMAGKYGFLRGLYHRWIVPRWLRDVSAIVTPSEATKNDLVELYHANPDRITVIPNGLDHTVFHPGDPELSRTRIREAYPAINRNYFVYVSRLEHPAKNHIRLMDAFRAFKGEMKSDHQLVFVGGDWQGAAVVRESGSDLVASGDLVITGFVPKDDIPHFLRAAEAMVYPSLYEGFGLPVIEAMGCGTPVACSGTSSLHEIAVDRALIFDPLSVGEIRDALGRLASDESLRRELAEEGMRHAEKFTWERCVEETIAVWREVA